MTKFSVAYILNPSATSTYMTISPKKSLSNGNSVNRHSKQCDINECDNRAVSRGRCVGHGGGQRCSNINCNSRAKLHGFCFQHGGYKICKVPKCIRKAKCQGMCWAHGGGRLCTVSGCSKVGTLGGLCWAHGGGRRCTEENCTRRSYQKYNYKCADHYLADQINKKLGESIKVVDCDVI